VEAEALTPVEFVFGDGPHFKTYAMKTSELHPEANIPVTDPELSAQLRQAALGVFRGFGATSYARLDFRQGPSGELFFLEINFGCSVFYSDGYEGSADYILRHDGLGQAGFAERIIAEGIARHRRRQKCYAVRGNSLSGFGIQATRALGAGEVVFAGEERAHRLVTRRHVAGTWTAQDRLLFRQYAYPLSSEVFAIWDDNPSAWAPQNHSCDPNTGYLGLNVMALRPIAAGEELTLDYRTMLNEDSEPFECHCGAASCRGSIAGAPGNSVTARETAGRLGRGQ
jgi:D-alanine-D-alanine ligase